MTNLVLNPPDPFAAIIFDCDGTLVDSTETYFLAFNDLFAPHGAAMSREWFIARLGLSWLDILGGFQESSGLCIGPTEAAQQFNCSYLGRLDSLREIEIVASVARRNQGNIPMAVASGGPREIVRATLSATGLLGLFQDVVTIEDVYGRGKPAPDLFKEAARRLGIEPQACVVFEDSDEGIEAAHRAGMRATDVRLFYRSPWRYGTAKTP